MYPKGYNSRRLVAEYMRKGIKKGGRCGLPSFVCVQASLHISTSSHQQFSCDLCNNSIYLIALPLSL